MTKRSIGVGVAVLLTALLGGLAGGACAQVRGPVASGEKFVLSGVIIFEGGGGLAWLQEPSITGDRAVPVRVSESIGPYRLTRILADRIELEGPAGTVLVPVLNAQSGGPALAQTNPGADPGGVAGRTRQPRPDASSDGAPAAGQSVSQPAAAAPSGAASPGIRALRDRLDLAKRQVEQLQRDPQSEALRLGTPLPNVPDPSAAQPNASSGSSGTQSGTTGRGGNPNMVTPAPRQTFQSILGLN